MTIMFRSLLLALGILSLLALGACGISAGQRRCRYRLGGGAIGKGPGLVTGREGGIVIYQK